MSCLGPAYRTRVFFLRLVWSLGLCLGTCSAFDMLGKSEIENQVDWHTQEHHDALMSVASSKLHAFDMLGSCIFEVRSRIRSLSTPKSITMHSCRLQCPITSSGARCPQVRLTLSTCPRPRACVRDWESGNRARHITQAQTCLIALCSLKCVCFSHSLHSHSLATRSLVS